jgi:hypothetical protein
LDKVVAVWEGMEWASASGLDAFFIKIDFEKAYDRVEWSFILATMKALVFGHFFIGTVGMLFVEAFTCFHH